MGERLGRAARWLRILFLSVVRFDKPFLESILSNIADVLDNTGGWLYDHLKRSIPMFWVFLGRCGLAQRKLLTVTFWRPYSWLNGLFVRGVRSFWAFLGRCGLALRKIYTVLIWRPYLWLNERFVGAIRRFWAFLGRCGLAQRKMLAATIWQPFVRFTTPIVKTFVTFWHFLGRCGLAFRDLLDRFLWRPFLVVSTPLRWFYRKFMQPPLGFAWLSLRTFLQWLLFDILLHTAKAVPGLARTIGRGIDDLLVTWNIHLPGRRTQVRTRLYDIGPRAARSSRHSNLPLPLEPVSSRPRLNRVTTAIVSTSVILLLSVLTTQGRDTGDAVALSQLSTTSRAAVAPLIPKMTNTPTATPTPMPTSTPTPMPTQVVENPLELWPTPDPLSAGGSVAFTVRENGNSDIFALTIGRSEPIRLTGHPADDRDPSWSPDGRQLAFTSHRDGNWEVYILDLQSGQIRRLTDNPVFDGAPSWSPDGQWLIFESYQQGNLDLYIVSANGSDPPIRLTEHPAQDYSPAWSPDGRHIAFTSWRSGNKDVFIMALDTASDEYAVNVTETLDKQEDHPAWEPQGRFLAYGANGNSLELIYALPLEGYAPAGPAFSIGQGHDPSWAPDGQSLVYVHDQENQSYLIAGSVDAWSVASQAYTGDSNMEDLDWTGVILPRGLEERFPVETISDAPLFVERSDPPQATGAAFMLRELDIEAPAPYLTDQVDDSFLALRGRVAAEVGWDFLGQVDNMFDFLASRPFPGESDKSWNKAARAFDFYYRYPISIDPQVEIVREDRGPQTYWRVFLRAAVQDGSHGEPLRQLPWDSSARYESDPGNCDHGGKLKEQIPTGYYIDFTRVAADYGWTRVPALENWRTFFQGIRYWHFENRQGMTWDEAIAELYTPEELYKVYGDH